MVRVHERGGEGHIQTRTPVGLWRDTAVCTVGGDRSEEPEEQWTSLARTR